MDYILARNCYRRIPIPILAQLFDAGIKTFITIIMKKGWENRFDKLWFDPESTILNWDGLFKERSLAEKLVGLGEWRGSIGNTLKEELSVLIKSFIKSEL